MHVYQLSTEAVKGVLNILTFLNVFVYVRCVCECVCVYTYIVYCLF